VQNTPRSTGTKKDEEKGRRGYSTVEAVAEGDKYSLSGVNSNGKGVTRGRIRGRKEGKEKEQCGIRESPRKKLLCQERE